MDDQTLLYAAIYMDPEMAELAHIILPRVEKKDFSDALYYAAMGMKKELLELDHHRTIQ